MMEFGTAEGYTGEKYHINGIFDMDNGTKIKTSNVAQRLVVTDKLRKGQRWSFVSEHSMGALGKDLRFKLLNVKDIDKNTKQLKFKAYRAKSQVEEIKYKIDAFKTLLETVNLNEKNFERLIKNMFAKVFVVKDAKKILESDDLEFISDGQWIYLRCGDTAYRI